MGIPQEAKEVLEKALNKLDVHGWTQGQAGNKEIGYCSIGALNAAHSKDYTIWQTAYSMLEDCIPKEFTRDPTSNYNKVAQYNDNPSTSEEDVRLVFKRAIYSLEEVESE